MCITTLVIDDSDISHRGVYASVITSMFLLPQVGDQLIEINGFSTHNITHTEAIDLIQNGGATVRLKVKRSAKMHPHLGASLLGSFRGHVGHMCLLI